MALVDSTKPALISFICRILFWGYVSFNLFSLHWVISALIAVGIYMGGIYFIAGKEIKSELSGLRKLKAA